MEGFAMGATILFLMGCLGIVIKGSWEMQKKLNRLEEYAVMITHFSHEISGLDKDEVTKKLEAFLKKNNVSGVKVTVKEK